MGKQNDVILDFLRDNHRFADLFNAGLFGGNCVNELKDVAKFTSELKELFAIMAYRKDKRGMHQFLEEHKEYTQLDEETARTIGTVMGVNIFMENNERFKTKGGYDMCTAIREMWTDGWNDG